MRGLPCEASSRRSAFAWTAKQGPAVVLALSLLAGCGYTGFESHHTLSLNERDGLVSDAPFPQLTPSVHAAAPATIETRPDGRRVIRLDLREALRLALKNNLQFLVEGEQLDVQLLSLEVLRRGWGPSISPLTATASWSRPSNGHSTGAEEASASLSQKLPNGGSASLTYKHAGSQPDGPDAYSGSATLSVTQPILKGAGHRQAVEEIVAAERGYAYARRSYTYNRLSLLVATVEAYFGLLQQEQNIRNFERNLERNRALARQADIREKFGQVTRSDVFRSQLEVTRAESALVDARERVKLAREGFKIDLGLRPELDLELAPEKIEHRPLELTQADAVALALENNAAWKIAKDRFDDAGRALALARNASLPQIDLTASLTWATETEPSAFQDYDTDTRTWSVGGTFSIPLDGHGLRRTYQTAVIAYRQAERDFGRARDRVVRDVQAQMIQLRQVELAMEFQKRAISDADKAGRLAEFDYRRGRVTNRDVIDAQDRLLEAQNAWQAALVGARIAQLRLLQFVGKLEADDEGRWLK